MKILRLGRFGLTDRDVENINNLLKELTSGKAKNYNRYDIRRIARQRRVFVHVAIDGPKNEIIGMAVLKIDDGRMFTQDYKKGYLGDIIVDENYRGRGIGEALTHSLMAVARSCFVQSVSLTSNPNNYKRARAIRMYERMGFKKIGEINGSNYYRINLTRDSS